MSSFVPCVPAFIPSPGHNDIRKHSETHGKYFYTVGLGFTTGIYTDE
jgi:hypothetical protein